MLTLELYDESCLSYFDDYKFCEIIFILNREKRIFSEKFYCLKKFFHRLYMLEYYIQKIKVVIKVGLRIKDKLNIISDTNWKWLASLYPC